MKKQAIYAMSLCAILASSCSSDNVTADGNGNTPAGNAFVALNINLPTTSGTSGRANEDAKYDHGKEEEYQVNDLTVLYFGGDEDDPVVAKSITYNKDELQWSTPTTAADGITTQATLPVVEVSSDINKVFVLINNGTGTNKLINITDNTTKWSDIQNTKFTGKDNAESLTGANKDNFFMTNSPLSDGTLLVNVQPKSTQAEARATTKTVYVERAVGKVSLSKGTGTDWSDWTYTIPTSSLSSYKDDQVEIQDWCLDITNRAEYAVRSYETTWNDIKNDKTGCDYIRFRDANENHLKSAT